ncbi:MAG: ankyrin repeat domain-containing protein [Endomicrobia bacterium]|nr:ankyrin repeat domain-containing protein [Endomicrobiia bacterium]
MSKGKTHSDRQKSKNKYADVNAKDSVSGMTPLLSAVIAGDKKIIELLLKNGADIKAADKIGNTALTWAIKCNADYQIINLLIHNGADINAKVHNEWAQTPLFYAVERGDKEIVELLLKNGADIKAVSRDGRTVLAVARNANDRELNVNKKLNVNNKELIEFLLKNGAANIKAAKGLIEDTRTVLTRKQNVNNRREEIIELLLKNGAE